VRRPPGAPRLRAEQVPHVAEPARQPRGVQGRRSRLPRPLRPGRRAARSRPRSPMAAAAGGGRQRLLHVQARCLRRHDVPGPRGRADGHVGRGIRPDDAVGRPLAGGPALMATVAGGVGCSHVPAVGAAIDKGHTGEPYWAPYFAKLERARRWIAEVDPDVCVGVSHAPPNPLSLGGLPPFPLGLADEFPPADEGYGPRPVPVVQGHPELAWHLAESLILDAFDLTVLHET